MERVHAVTRETRRNEIVTVVAGTIAGIVTLILAIAPGVPLYRLVLAAVSAISFITVPFSAWFLAVAKRLAVTMRDDSIQFADGPPVLWSEIDGLCHRDGRQRLDVLSGTMVRGSISYAIEDAPDVISRVVMRTRLALPREHRVFRATRAVLHLVQVGIVCAAITAGAAWLAVWLGVIVGAMALWYFGRTFKDECTRVEILDDGVRIHTPLSHREIPRTAIARVHLLLIPRAVDERRHELRAVLKLDPEDYVSAAPRGVEPSHIYRALIERWPELALAETKNATDR